MWRNGHEFDGRWLSALIVLGYFGLLIVGQGIFHLPVWRCLGVPMLPAPFHDLRDIAMGIDRFNHSERPWSAESLAYSTSAYNYTKWWLCAGYLGLNLDTVNEFGVGLGLLFFACALLVLGRLSVIEGCVAGLVLVSPTIMTAIERANADLVIFSLLTLALGLRRFTSLATASVTLAAVLKLYPVVAFAALAASPWRKTVPWLAAAIAIIGVDLVTSLGEMHDITSHVTRVGWFSYGSTTMFEGYWETLPPGATYTYNEAFLIGSFLLATVMAVSLWVRPRVEIQPKWERALAAFRIGAALFLGTFAFGSNLDYRTVVLIFCLPLLFVLRNESGSVAFWATGAIFSVVLYTNTRLLWNDAVPVFFFLKQLTAWFLVALLTGIYAATFNWPRSTERANVT